MDKKDILDENQILPEKDAEITIEAANEAIATVADATEQTEEKPKKKRAPRKKTQSDISDSSKPQDTDAKCAVQETMELDLPTVKSEGEDEAIEKLPPANETDTVSTDESAPTSTNELAETTTEESVTEAVDEPFADVDTLTPAKKIENYSMFEDKEQLPPPPLDDLVYDDEPREKPDDDKGADGFNDFLASYRRQIAEMMRSKESAEDSDTGDTGDTTPENEKEDDSPYPFFDEIEAEGGVDEEDEAVQLTIDLTAVPFSPLMESEKKQSSDGKEYKYNPKKPGFINNLFDMVEIFVFTVLAVLIISAFFLRHSMVEGGSMNDTLHDGEHLIITNLFYTPDRGDIIVFEDYSIDKKPIVKRVIGIEGDTVRVENENGVAVVYLNGDRLEEKYTLTDDKDTHPTGEWTVGEDQLFVMGDHRNSSWDGRSFGLIHADSVLGKAVFRFYPFDRFGKID